MASDLKKLADELFPPPVEEVKEDDLVSLADELFPAPEAPLASPAGVTEPEKPPPSIFTLEGITEGIGGLIESFGEALTQTDLPDVPVLQDIERVIKGAGVGQKAIGKGLAGVGQKKAEGLAALRGAAENLKASDNPGARVLGTIVGADIEVANILADVPAKALGAIGFAAAPVDIALAKAMSGVNVAAGALKVSLSEITAAGAEKAVRLALKKEGHSDKEIDAAITKLAGEDGFAALWRRDQEARQDQRIAAFHRNTIWKPEQWEFGGGTVRRVFEEETGRKAEDFLGAWTEPLTVIGDIAISPFFFMGLRPTAAVKAAKTGAVIKDQARAVSKIRRVRPGDIIQDIPIREEGFVMLDKQGRPLVTAAAVDFDPVIKLKSENGKLLDKFIGDVPELNNPMKAVTELWEKRGVFQTEKGEIGIKSAISIAVPTKGFVEVSPRLSKFLQKSADVVGKKAMELPVTKEILGGLHKAFSTRRTAHSSELGDQRITSQADLTEGIAEAGRKSVVDEQAIREYAEQRGVSFAQGDAELNRIMEEYDRGFLEAAQEAVGTDKPPNIKGATAAAEDAALKEIADVLEETPTKEAPIGIVKVKEVKAAGVTKEEAKTELFFRGFDPQGGKKTPSTEAVRPGAKAQVGRQVIEDFPRSQVFAGAGGRARPRVAGIAPRGKIAVFRKEQMVDPGNVVSEIKAGEQPIAIVDLADIKSGQSPFDVLAKAEAPPKKPAAPTGVQALSDAELAADIGEAQNAALRGNKKFKGQPIEEAVEELVTESNRRKADAKGRKAVQEVKPEAEAAAVEKKVEPEVAKVAPDEEVVRPRGVAEAKVAQLATDPERFQFRGAGIDNARVDQIVENFRPELFDPIDVWKDPETGKLTVLEGHHRLEVAKRLGLDDIEIRVFEGSEVEAIELARRKNAVRADFSTLDKTRIYKGLEKEGKSVAQISVDQGVTEKTVRKHLRIAKLDSSLHPEIDAGAMSSTMAEALGAAVEKNSIPKAVHSDMWKIVEAENLSATGAKEMINNIWAEMPKGKIQQTLFGQMRESPTLRDGIRTLNQEIITLNKWQKDIKAAQATLKKLDTPETLMALNRLEIEAMTTSERVERLRKKLLSQAKREGNAASKLGKRVRDERGSIRVPGMGDDIKDRPKQAGLFHYSGPIRQLILDAKFGGSERSAAKLITQALDELGPRVPKADVIVSVPSVETKLNISQGFAEALARDTGIEHIDALEFTRVKKRGQGGLSRAGRIRNVDKLHRVRKSFLATVKGKDVLLVDDLITTGATLADAKRALKAAGAKRVEVLTIAAQDGRDVRRVVRPSGAPTARKFNHEVDSPEKYLTETQRGFIESTIRELEGFKTQEQITSHVEKYMHRIVEPQTLKLIKDIHLEDMLNGKNFRDWVNNGLGPEQRSYLKRQGIDPDKLLDWIDEVGFEEAVAEIQKKSLPEDLALKGKRVTRFRDLNWIRRLSGMAETGSSKARSIFRDYKMFEANQLAEQGQFIGFVPQKGGKYRVKDLKRLGVEGGKKGQRYKPAWFEEGKEGFLSYDAPVYKESFVASLWERRMQNVNRMNAIRYTEAVRDLVGVSPGAFAAMKPKQQALLTEARFDSPVLNDLVDGWHFDKKDLGEIRNSFRAMDEINQWSGLEKDMPSVMTWIDNVNGFQRRWALVGSKYLWNNWLGNRWNNWLADLRLENYGVASDFMKSEYLRQIKSAEVISPTNTSIPAFVSKKLKGKIRYLPDDIHVLNDSGQWLSVKKVFKEFESVGEFRQPGPRGTYGHQEVEIRIKEFDNGLDGIWSKTAEKVPQAVFELNKFLENYDRFALYLDRRIKGFGLREALADVHKYHFDYFDLSRFERAVMRRIAFFYTWHRKNMALQVRELGRQPWKYRTVEGVFRTIEADASEDGAGLIPKIFNLDKANRPDKKRVRAVDKWILREGHVIGGFTREEGGRTIEYVSFVLPTTGHPALDAENEVEEFFSPSLPEWIPNNWLTRMAARGRRVLAKAVPGIQFPLEMFSNRKIFSGGKINKGDPIGERVDWMGAEVPPNVKHIAGQAFFPWGRPVGDFEAAVPDRTDPGRVPQAQAFTRWVGFRVMSIPLDSLGSDTGPKIKAFKNDFHIKRFNDILSRIDPVAQPVEYNKVVARRQARIEFIIKRERKKAEEKRKQ